MKTRKVTCRTHGATAWRGDMVCAACGKAYLDAAARPCVETCACGARFSPNADDPSAEFSARVACRRCATMVSKRQVIKPS